MAGSIETKAISASNLKLKLKLTEDELGNYCYKAFKKIRIKGKKIRPINKKISSLINERNSLARIGCICKKEFPIKRDLEAHKKAHTAKLKFECNECGKDCKLKEGLRNHIKKHEDQKFSCTECGKQFKREDIFVFHLNVHAEKTHYKRPTKSSLCDIYEKHFTGKVI